MHAHGALRLAALSELDHHPLAVTLTDPVGHHNLTFPFRPSSRRHVFAELCTMTVSAPWSRRWHTSRLGQRTKSSQPSSTPRTYRPPSTSGTRHTRAPRWARRSFARCFRAPSAGAARPGWPGVAASVPLAVLPRLPVIAHSV